MARNEYVTRAEFEALHKAMGWHAAHEARFEDRVKISLCLLAFMFVALIAVLWAIGIGWVG